MPFLQAASFQRARRSASGGRTAARWLFGLTGGFLISLWLSIAGLLGELLITSGNVSVPRGQAATLEAASGMPADARTAESVEYRQRGLIAAVAKAPQSPLAVWFARFYRGLPALRANPSCLALLLVFGTAVSVLLVLVLQYQERSGRLAAHHATTHMRAELRAQMLRLEPAELPGAISAAAVDLFTHQIDALRLGLAAWWSSLPGDLIWLVCITMMGLAIQPWIALSAVLFAALGGLLLSSWQSRRQQHQALLADQAGQHMSALLDSLGQSRLLTGNLLEEVPGHSFGELLEQHEHAASALATASASHPAARLYSVIAASLIVWLIGRNVLGAGALTPSEGVMLLLVVASAYRPLNRLYQLVRAVRQADMAASEAFAYLDRLPAVGQLVDASPLGPISERIDFDHVSLVDHSGQSLLDDVSLAIPAGRRVAIVSSHPETPLAVACLFPRFCDPSQGKVLFDKTDIRSGTLHSLRSQASVLLHEGLLFPGTVAENIRCGNDRSTAQQLTDVLKAARADEFVAGLPEGMETQIGNHGVRLFPDQKLRIGLARVLLRNPSLVVVEEPADDLPAERAAALDAAVDAVAAHRTLIVLPGRLSTLRTADLVYLFHEGKLQAQGTHAELLEQSQLYRHLVYIRFNEFR